MCPVINTNAIFSINSEKKFEESAIQIFNHQASNNLVYRSYIENLKIEIDSITKISEIPFLPVEFFKTHKVVSTKDNVEQIFKSSGTTGKNSAKHFVTDLGLYEKSLHAGFEYFYGSPDQYNILALLPSYLEQNDSSLVFMVKQLMDRSQSKFNKFYLYNYNELADVLNTLEKKNQKTILIGVSFALLEMAEKYHFNLKNTIIIETGGMKGRRKELTRSELHKVLKDAFMVSEIHSEYGMTELLSQAYSYGQGRFNTPPWMKIVIRDMHDPFTCIGKNKSGGINVIDLANYNSCSFIETKDIGIINSDDSFGVLGRFDNSDIRGCNLMVE